MWGRGEEGKSVGDGLEIDSIHFSTVLTQKEMHFPSTYSFFGGSLNFQEKACRCHHLILYALASLRVAY
jgi:hypothetical protein